MAKIPTPFGDLVERLLSTQMSTPDVVATIRAAEVAATTNRSSHPDDRKRWADQKKRQRGAPTQMSTPADVAAISSSKTDSDLKDSEERNSAPNASGVDIAKPARSKGARIPDDWQPSVDDYAYGVDQVKLHRHEVTACAEEMKLWAQANANRAVARKADWGLTFKGWMRRAAPQIIRNRPRGGSNGQANSAGVGFAGRAAEARARIQERFGDPERPAPEDLQPINGR